LNNPNGLVDTIVDQLRPVVLQAVRTAITSSAAAGNLNAEDLTGKILVQLRPFVLEGVTKQIQEITSGDDDIKLFLQEISISPKL